MRVNKWIKLLWISAIFGLFAVSVAGAQSNDLNSDGRVDRLDVLALLDRLGQDADGSGDPRDLDADGRISILDARLLVLACDLDGCGQAPSSAALFVAIDSDRPSAGVGGTFNLQGKVLVGSEPIVDWAWSFGDGRTASGPGVSVAYGSAGVFSVRVLATTASGGEAEGQLLLSVLDANSSAAPGLGLSDHLGDVDANGSVELLDALRVAQAAARVAALDSEAEEKAADLSFDFQVGADDARLIGLAVLADADWPRRLEPQQGAPGALVKVYSPELLDPSASIQIEVGASLFRQSPGRLVRGYGTILIPLDPSFPGSNAVVPGTIEVRIYRDGQLVDVLDFELLSPAPLPANPKQALIEFLDAFMLVQQEGEIAVGEMLDLIEVSDADREALVGILDATQRLSRQSVDQWKALLAGPEGDDLAQLFFQFAAANGLNTTQSAFRAFLDHGVGSEELAKVLDPDEVCDVGIPTLCTIQVVSNLLDRGSGIVGFFCDVLLIAGLAAVIFPGDGPVLDVAVLGSWVAACGQVELALGLGSLVRSLVASIQPELRFRATTTQPPPGSSTILQGSLDMIGIDEICSLAAGQVSTEIGNRMAEAVVGLLLQRKLALRAIADLLVFASQDLFSHLVDLLEDTVGLIIEQVGIGDAFQNFAANLCSTFGLNVELPISLLGILEGPEPPIGDLLYLGSGEAEYSCPTGPGAQAGVVDFVAHKNICGVSQSESLSVRCGGTAVTITMGDNGSLLDDIFEVRVEGQTVLTSSVPVRSVSTTLDLPSGAYNVSMLGRAAPDGIGTYYIQFSGASVLAGDSLSGSDLTPGVTKTFLIEVP